ncbi:MAG: restriction endonuclease subunit S, partial [Candidatus Cloacimonadota bacterium]|nr:restriction endonuclease subunit S [Candidatus Cloacimonadota bacterium]
EKIAEEKDRLIKEGKIKKQKKLPEITEEEKPFDLPVGWEWVRLGTALKKITDGTHHSPPNYEHGEFLYISAKNIKYKGISLEDVSYVTREIHNEIFSRCNPEFGDILYIKDGATTGVATINNLKDPFSMLSSVALLKLPKGVFNSYLLLALISPFFYDSIRSDMTGVAITRVTLNKLNSAFIPLPPLAEQHRIVSKVDELMALCDTFKSCLTDAQATQKQLVNTVVNQVVG